jgi:hypothetical protein
MSGDRRTESSRRIDAPEAGYFLVRLVRNGPWVAARIVRDEHGWHAVIDGKRGESNHDPALADGVSRIWEWGRRVTQTEHDYHREMGAWARGYAPQHPAADPTRPYDPLTAPPSF